MDLTGKIAIITGSSRGIGNAIARKLAGAGATTVVNGITDAARVEQAAEDIRAMGHECTGIQADIGSAEGAAKLVDTAMGKLQTTVKHQ